MEIVRIHDKLSNILLYLNNNYYFGYKFNNDKTIENINKSVFKYFSFLLCSNNFTRLSDENNYKVILDNDTNFKHYFKGPYEDYEMFFLNNGKSITLFDKDIKLDDNLIKKNNLSKQFIIGTLTIVLSLNSMMLVDIWCNKYIQNNYENLRKELGLYDNDDELISYIKENDLTIQDIIYLINKSPNLSESEKDYLIQIDYISDILNEVNQDNFYKYELMKSLTDLSINNFDNDKNDLIVGYYDTSKPNKIFVRDYKKIDYLNKDCISHEFIHLTQEKCSVSLNVISEACAEIISNEYYPQTSIDTYHEEVKIIKKLMEIIGSYPIWHYNFTGDFSLIEKEIKPYFSELDYDEFLKDLSYDNSDIKDKITKCYNLNLLISKLYYNKYNENISNNLIMNLITNNDKSLKRYYFNKRYINMQNSYYYDYNDVYEITMTLDEAILNDYVYPYINPVKHLNEDELNDILNSNENNYLNHNVTFNNIVINGKLASKNSYIDNFKELKLEIKNNKLYIFGKLDGKIICEEEKYFIDNNILLNRDYYYIGDAKKLSKEEYFNQEYDDSLIKMEYYKNPDYEIISSEDNKELIVLIPTKKQLPTIDENNSQLSK